MVSIIISTQSGGTALFYAGWEGRSEVVKLLLGAGARDIPTKVDHRVTMMCRKSVLMNHRVYVDTSVCQTYSRELSRVGLEPTTLCSLDMGQLSRQSLTKRFVVFMKIAYKSKLGFTKAQFTISRNKEVWHCSCRIAIGGWVLQNCSLLFVNHSNGRCLHAH